MLHGAVACLLYRVLCRLAIPGAFLAAMVFAVHPVCVESVAWISEQKNTLSGVFYLSAGLTYLCYDRERRFLWYALGTGLFGLALLSKSVTATLPAALLVVFWWKRGRLTWKSDLMPLVPWFVLGAGAGTVTAWMERTHVGASGAAYGLDFVERSLVAGRAIWFYLEKIFWPAELIFIYPRWTVDARDLWQYLFPVGAIAVLVSLLALRHRVRGPLGTALLFTGTLFPALGFFNVFPFLYSYVADHFQYLAAAMMLSAATSVLTLATGRLSAGGRLAARAAAVCVVAALAGLTWRQCAMYVDRETLWRTTIARNPACWMAHNNLGGDLLQAGRPDEAMASIQTALKYAPDNAAAHTNLGNALWQKRQMDGAFAQYKRALEIEPDNVGAHNNLGNALLQTGRVNEAIAHYEKALAIRPDFAKAHTNLGDAFLQAGRADEAVAQYSEALENDPNDVEAHSNLGTILAQKGRLDEAMAHFHTALKINPDFAIAHFDLGNALLQAGRVGDAIAEYQKTLEIKPDFPRAHTYLGDALLQTGRVDEAVAQYNKALEFDAKDAEAHTNLGTVVAQRGRLDEAIAHFQAAVEINPSFAIARTNLGGAFLQKGRIDDAVAQYRKALEIDPNSVAAHRGLDRALLQKRRLDEADAQSREASRLK
jgi:tetratricopeptide (TPR) repeat protein